MAIVCESPAHLPQGEPLDPAARATALATYIAERVTNPEAVAVLTGLSQADREAKGRLLLEEAAKAGLERCPLADWKP